VGVELARSLAEYALSVQYESLDLRTAKEMKARIVDALGCAIGAYGEEPVAIGRRAVAGLRGTGKSTLLGTKSKTTPELATFVNGLMIRYFDFNDTYLSREPAHPSDNLAPCFAVGESEATPGKETIAAAVAAYEIQCRLCDAANIRSRGWDHVNYGLVSSSLAAAKLMGLDGRKAAESVNIALGAHIAMRQVRTGELSMWKGASFSNAARNGVFGALLAREGMTGPSPIFEGEMGFFRQVSGRFSLDIQAFGGRGGAYKVNETYIKYWPAEYHAQSAIWAALEVRRHMKDLGNVRSVLVETHEAGLNILGKDEEKWKPKTRETADHSLPYIVGMALMHGTVDNSTYSTKSLTDPNNLRFIRKIRVVEDSEFTALYPATGIANRVTVTERGGREIRAQIVVPKGHPLNPMTRDDIEAKFLRLTKKRLGEVRAREALSRLWNLEKERDLAGILGLLRVDGGSKA